MEQAESPNIPFTVLRTRFEKAPSVVVYDNACNLQAYAFNRDPGYFKSTLFVVDRFHWFNHTGKIWWRNVFHYLSLHVLL